MGQSAYTRKYLWFISFGWKSGVDSTESELAIAVRVSAEW
jgi:hypothetical protein